MTSRVDNERGIALLLVVFIVSLATVIVFDLGVSSRLDQRISRSFTESVQAEFILKSELNLARILLEAPKLDGIQEDWLNEPWALIGSAPALPISGFAGNPRLMIVDVAGKIDLNAVAPPAGTVAPPTGSASNPGEQLALFWKNAMRELLTKAGFVREQYEADLYRTPGNIAYDPADQVAVLQDWIDEDKRSYSSASFDGDGFESQAPDGMFLNRRLKSLGEMLLVPGFTPERAARIGRFVTVSTLPSTAQRQINVNTAPIEVLLAIGFPEQQAIEIIQQRANLPITQAILNTLVEGDPQLRQVTRVTSTEFQVLAQVAMPTVTRWLEARVGVSGRATRRSRIMWKKFY
ncbi:MAG: general secretion pathway protein GspK [Bdellovibrionales bacterium]|nr:general secretion pathway protein GspK [Bdellovibrionales bacterium]